MKLILITLFFLPLLNIQAQNTVSETVFNREKIYIGDGAMFYSSRTGNEPALQFGSASNFQNRFRSTFTGSLIDFVVNNGYDHGRRWDTGTTDTNYLKITTKLIDTTPRINLPVGGRNNSTSTPRYGIDFLNRGLNGAGALGKDGADRTVNTPFFDEHLPRYYLNASSGGGGNIFYGQNVTENVNRAIIFQGNRIGTNQTLHIVGQEQLRMWNMHWRNDGSHLRAGIGEFNRNMMSFIGNRVVIGDWATDRNNHFLSSSHEDVRLVVAANRHHLTKIEEVSRGKSRGLGSLLVRKVIPATITTPETFRHCFNSTPGAPNNCGILSANSVRTTQGLFETDAAANNTIMPGAGGQTDFDKSDILHFIFNNNREKQVVFFPFTREDTQKVQNWYNFEGGLGYVDSDNTAVGSDAASNSANYYSSQDFRVKNSYKYKMPFGNILDRDPETNGVRIHDRNGYILQLGFQKSAVADNQFMVVNVDNLGAGITEKTFFIELAQGDNNFNRYVNEQITLNPDFKTFVIPHPLDKERYLVHSALEGPSVDVFYKGSSQLEQGKNSIKLPDYVESLIEEGTMTIQVTPIGGFDPIYVLKNEEGPILQNNRFTVMSPIKDSRQEFDWIVKATRKTVDKQVVEPYKSNVTLGGAGPYKYIKTVKERNND